MPIVENTDRTRLELIFFVIVIAILSYVFTATVYDPFLAPTTTINTTITQVNNDDGTYTVDTVEGYHLFFVPDTYSSVWVNQDGQNLIGSPINLGVRKGVFTDRLTWVNSPPVKPEPPAPKQGPKYVRVP